MREIKFRAWFYDGEDLSTGEMISADTAWREDYIEFNDNELLPTDSCTILMQYTGLKDRTGREIFEGDILAFDSHEWYRLFKGEKDYVFKVERSETG